MEGFAIIPYELYDALAEGDLTPSMFLAMSFLHRWADWGTGVARKVRAGRMEQATNGQYAASTFQEALRNLKKAGRISDDHVQGSRTWYSITIHNFTVLKGGLKGQVINPSKITDWHVSKNAHHAEEQCDGGVRPGRDHDETMTVLKSSQESSQTSSRESETKLPPSIVPAPPIQGENPTDVDIGPDWESIQANSDAPTKHARSLLAYIVSALLEGEYSSRNESQHLPRFVQEFRSIRSEAAREEFHDTALLFTDWVKASPKLNQKFNNVADFWHHFQDSDSDNSLRRQFNAIGRAARKADPEELEGTLRAIGKIARRKAAESEEISRSYSHDI